MSPLSMFFLTLFLLITTRADDDSSEEKIDTKSKPYLEKFVKLVEDNKLNVTFFSTEDKYYDNGKLKESFGIASTYPPTEDSVVPLTKSRLTNEIIDEFLQLAQTNKIVAYSRTIKIENGNVVKEDVRSKSSLNIEEMKPKSTVYKWSTHVENGHRGFQMKDKSYGLLTNFNVVGSDGKNHTVTTVESFIEVQLKEKSSGISEQELYTIKKILPKIQLIYNEDLNRAAALATELNKRLPGNDWQVIINPEEYEVSSSKFAVLDAVSIYLIFSLNH